MDGQTSLKRNERLLDALSERLASLERDLSIVLDSVMELYQEHSRHAGAYKYGPQDTAAAYMAIKNLMEAGTSLDTFYMNVEETKGALRVISGMLYQEQKEE